ncbi:MAG: thioredoxin family protein [Synergistaceae bacterium]|nr:thioredoxin family protein [Synergistaceae bacterium]
MSVKIITGDNAAELESAKVAFLDISATWCGPCKMIAPVVEELSESPDFAGRVEFFNADAEENPALAKKLRVMSIPSLMILKEGKVTARKVGFQSAPDLKAWIEENI